MKRAPLISVGISLLFSLVSLPLQSQVSFFQPPPYAGSSNSSASLFVADFNSDGKLDLLTPDGTLNLGNGDGTFTLGTPVTGTPVAIGDFNGDGKMDILEQTTGSQAVSALVVLLGNGDGMFQAPISTLDGVTTDFISVGVVSLRGDGKLDVVAVTATALMVYLGNGDGTFVANGVSYSFQSGNSPIYGGPLSFGDFNGDGKIDVAMATATTSPSGGAEDVFPGNGDGTLQTAIPSAAFNLYYFAQSTVAGDFNGDGKLDLAVSSAPQCHGSCQGTVYILLGNGDGTFQSYATAFPGEASGGLPAGPVAAADVNGDGKLDLIFEFDYSATAQVYLGNGDGTFSNPSDNISNYVPVAGLGVLTPGMRIF